MTILAIDTAANACSLALGNGKDDPVVVREMMNTGHAEVFYELLGKLLARSGTAQTDIKSIIVSVGPGSFTGIRVGVAFARAVMALHDGSVEYQSAATGKRSVTLRFPAERVSK